MNSSKLKSLLAKYKKHKWNVVSSTNESIAALAELCKDIKEDRELTLDEQYQLVIICLRVDAQEHPLTATITDDLLNQLGDKTLIQQLAEKQILNEVTYSIILKYPYEYMVELIEHTFDRSSAPEENSFFKKLLEFNYSKLSLDLYSESLSIVKSVKEHYLSHYMHRFFECATELSAISNLSILLNAYKKIGILDETALNLLFRKIDSIKTGLAYKELVNYVLENELDFLSLQMMIITNHNQELRGSVTALSAIPNLPKSVKEKALIILLNNPECQNIIIKTLQACVSKNPTEAFYHVLLDDYAFADKLLDGMLLIYKHDHSIHFDFYLKELKKHPEHSHTLARIYTALESISLTTKSFNELCHYITNNTDQAENIETIIKALILKGLCYQKNLTVLLQAKLFTKELASILEQVAGILSQPILDKILSNPGVHKQITPAIKRLSEIGKLSDKNLIAILDNPQNSNQLVNQFCRSANSNTLFKASGPGNTHTNQHIGGKIPSPTGF